MNKRAKMIKCAMYQAFYSLYRDQATDIQVSFEGWKELRSATLKVLPKNDRAVLREFHKNELKEIASFYLKIIDSQLFERKRKHNKKAKKAAVA